jgi:hypothetical protein
MRPVIAGLLLMVVFILLCSTGCGSKSTEPVKLEGTHFNRLQEMRDKMKMKFPKVDTRKG